MKTQQLLQDICSKFCNARVLVKTKKEMPPKTSGLMKKKENEIWILEEEEELLMLFALFHEIAHCLSLTTYEKELDKVWSDTRRKMEALTKEAQRRAKRVGLIEEEKADLFAWSELVKFLKKSIKK